MTPRQTECPVQVAGYDFTEAVSATVVERISEVSALR